LLERNSLKLGFKKRKKMLWNKAYSNTEHCFSPSERGMKIVTESSFEFMRKCIGLLKFITTLVG